MKLLLDEDLPRELVRHFAIADHEVAHVEDLGWAALAPAALSAISSAPKGEATIVRPG